MATTLGQYGPYAGLLAAAPENNAQLSASDVAALWDQIAKSNSIQKAFTGAGLSWDQLTPQDQSIISQQLISNPDLIFQDIAGHDMIRGDAYNVRSIGDTNTLEAQSMLQQASPYFSNYHSPTQSEFLYRLNPQLAANYGITADTVAANRAAQDAAANKLDAAERKQQNKEAALMALTVLTAGAAGGAFSGAGAAAGEGAAAGSAASSGSAWGGLGDIAAGSGAAGSAGGSSALAGAAAGDASFVGPATGSLAPSTATTTVSAAPGISSAGITTADLAAYGGTAGALANASNYGNSSGNSTNNTPNTYNPNSGLLNNLGTKEAVALGGGLLGSLNGAEKAGTTTTTQAPWAPQQPYLLDAFEKAKQASQGNALTQQANANYQSVLGGPTVNPMLGMNNPYLTSAINNANYDVNRAFMPAMNQANRASGSYGNSGVADVYSKNMLDAYSRNATNMRMTDYTNQQNLQQQAVNNTLGFTKGANEFSAEPAKTYAQTIQGSYGGSTSTPYYTNPYANVLGGITTGLGLYNAYTGSK